MGKVLEKRVELVAFSADKKGITFNSKVADVPAIEFDHARIGQVFDNILTNAVKFSAPDSIIETEVRSDSQAIFIDVRDHGQGIPPEEIDKIFVAFEKLSTKPTAGEKSTGLGMSIVKKIVDAHSGNVYVESTPGEGTTFTVSLPIKATA